MSKLFSGTEGALQINTADIADDAVTLAKLSATGTPSSSNFLRGDNTFAEAGAGLKFINTADFSGGSSHNFTATDASKYDCYRMILQSVVPSGAAVYAELRTSTDGGSNYDTSSGEYQWVVTKLGGDAGADVLYSAAVIELLGDASNTDTVLGSGANEHGISGWIDVIAPNLTTNTTVQWQLSWITNNSSQLNVVAGAGTRKSAADVDAFQFKFEGGANLESGSITTYGWANA